MSFRSQWNSQSPWAHLGKAGNACRALIKALFPGDVSILEKPNLKPEYQRECSLLSFFSFLFLLAQPSAIHFYVFSFLSPFYYESSRWIYLLRLHSCVCFSLSLILTSQLCDSSFLFLPVCLDIYICTYEYLLIFEWPICSFRQDDDKNSFQFLSNNTIRCILLCTILIT